MNPDQGEEAEDWFAKLEREARETARKRDGDPQAPQLVNPFGAPPAGPGIPPQGTPGMPPQGAPQGAPPQGAPPQGFPGQPVPPQGVPGMPQGVPPQGMPPGYPAGYPGQPVPPQGAPGVPPGYPPQGMPPQGAPPQGMPPQGVPGVPPQGFPPQGVPPQGVPPQGVPPLGMPSQGVPGAPPQGAPGYPQPGHPPHGALPGQPPQGFPQAQPGQGFPPAQPPTVLPPVGQPPAGQQPAGPPPLVQPPANQPVAQPPATQRPGAQHPSGPSSWDQPTQAIGRVEPEQTQALPEPTKALVPAELRRPEPKDDGEEPSALDALFGDDAFREYDSGLGPDPSNAPFANRAKSKDLVVMEGGDGTPPPPREFGTLQKALIGVGAGLLAIIVLIGLFMLGTRLPDMLGPAPAVATPTPTPTPTLTALPVGPVPAGATYAWDELLGGECIDPFIDAWEEEYTVVDCDEPHAAQMVYRAWFPNPDADPLDPTIPATVRPGSSEYPGAEALAAQITILCTAPGIIDLAVAGAYSDAQIQGAYPATKEQWDADPSYYCFVSRSSGEPLTGSVAAPREETQPTP